MLTVDQVVSTWTPEEREKLKDLIKESKEREKLIEGSSKKCSKKLEEGAEVLVELICSIAKLQEESQTLLDLSQETFLKLSNNIPST